MWMRGYELTPEEFARIQYCWEVELFFKGHPFEYIENLPLVRKRQIRAYQNGRARAQRESQQASNWR